MKNQPEMLGLQDPRSINKVLDDWVFRGWSVVMADFVHSVRPYYCFLYHVMTNPSVLGAEVNIRDPNVCDLHFVKLLATPNLEMENDVT